MTNKNLIERLKAHSHHCAEAYECEEYLPMAKFWAKYEALSSEAAALIEQQEALLAEMRTALVAAMEMSNIMEGLTSCRGDDDYVWGVQGKIEAALLAAKTHLGD